MKTSGLARRVFVTASVSFALVGCGASQAPIRPLPVSSQQRLMNPDSATTPKRGIYASEFFGSSQPAVLGYRYDNRKNRPPICTVNVSGDAIAVDGSGNLIAGGAGNEISVFQGPHLCGPQVGSLHDPYGQPSDFASIDARNDRIVIGNIFDTSGEPGSIAVCTLKAGCTANLINSSMYEVAGVALARNGDCWASSTDSAGTARLTYFKGCSGAGQAATGYVNSYYGGLDIDTSKNLLAISAFNSQLFVYHGCNPACKLVGGPFLLKNETVFGHLNEDATRYAGADFATGAIDVYKYSPTTGLTYLYSFDNGLNASFVVESAAYSPHSRE
jgi:hypothetical protein